MIRKNISKTLWNEVVAKQKTRCKRCNGVLDPRYIDIHHKKPVSEGGKNELKNLIAVCANCHKILQNKQRLKKKKKKKKKKMKKKPLKQMGREFNIFNKRGQRKW